MPETEPKPKLIELVAPGGGQGWKAVLKNGKPAVVHEIPVPQAESVAAAPRLQRLYEHRHPALSPVLAWGTEDKGVWVAVEPNEGTPLSTILSRGPLTPPAAATLGAAVLSGVAALHEAGIAMGGFGATAVRITSNGEARLAGHPTAAVRGAPSQSDLRADVRSCGMAVCAAFGVDPAGAPAPPNIPPGLVVTMRSMASGAMGPSADRALAALREMAAALLAPDRQMAAQSELATRSGGREVPPITPFLPAGAIGPGPQPSPSQAVPVAPAPAPYIAPPRREETPVRQSASYEAPDRPVQTYPSIPAVSFPPAPPPPPIVEPPIPPARPAPAVPTWAEAAAPVESAPAEALPAEPAPSRPPAPTWDEPSTPVPPAPVPTFSTAPPAPPPTFSTAPPAPAPPPVFEPPTPAPVPAQPAWTPVESPVWKPGQGVPAEPLGSGFTVETPRPPTTPPPSRTPTVPPPARRPTVPRPPVGGGILAERPPWLVPGAVAVVIILLLGIVGIRVLSGRGGGSPIARTSPTASATVHPSSSPHATPSASPTGKTPLPVPTTYGPATANPVRSIQICSPASPCTIPGSSAETGSSCGASTCTLEVAMYFTAVQKSVAISYTIKFFDRCTGQTTDLPGAGTTTPSTGYIVAIPTDHLAVEIPSGAKSGAIVAVSQTPAIAASAPLLVGSQDSC